MNLESEIAAEDIMQMAITFMAVVAGMVFSLAVALLVEEIIFGQVFRLLFASGKLTSGSLASAAQAPTLAAKSAARVGHPQMVMAKSGQQQ